MHLVGINIIVAVHGPTEATTNHAQICTGGTYKQRFQAEFGLRLETDESGQVICLMVCIALQNRVTNRILTC